MKSIKTRNQIANTHPGEFSISGLLAAAVCSDHFESLLVIEAEGSPAEIGVDKPKTKAFRTMVDGLPTVIPLRERVLQYVAIHSEHCN